MILRVFPRRTSMTPTDEYVRIGEPDLFLPDDITEVHISTCFTWDFYESDRLFRAWEKIAPVKVGGPAHGREAGDFNPGLYVKKGCVITSRGCPNHCWFCAVWKNEGNIRELTIEDGYNVLDSNLLACSDDHIKRVFTMLSKQTERVKFTGGFEAKRFQEWHIDQLLRLTRRPLIFFAYDTPDDYEPLRIARAILKNAGITRHYLCCYCLVGYRGDTFESAEKRLNQIIGLDMVPYVMIYRDREGYLNPEWIKIPKRVVQSGNHFPEGPSVSLKAPFPYFGGKSRVAAVVWRLLGQPKHYIEPFFGSGAVLLVRPHYKPTMIETVNDADGHIANVWRAIQFASEETARWCDWPVNHADLSARRKELIKNSHRLIEKLAADPEFYDAKLAGYWIWAASCWIGSGLTFDTIPNVGRSPQGVHSRIPRQGRRAFGIQAQMPHVSGFPWGIQTQRPHLLSAGGINGKRPKLTGNKGCGVHRSACRNGAIYEWFDELAARLRNVRVVCGDWARVCGGNWQDYVGTCGIFFDPPYGDAARRKNIYAKDSLDVAGKVREWALGRAQKETYRIVIAGYYEEHECLLSEGWGVHRWSTNGGYSNLGHNQGRKNKDREALFYSPHCLPLENEQRELF